MTNDLLTRVMTALIRRAKRDPGYQLDSALSGAALLSILWRRGLAFLRGLWWAWRLGACRLPFFVGRRVTILHPRLLRVGRSVTLEDDVLIDALSRQGVALGDNVSISRGTVIKATGVLTRLGLGCEIGANSNLGHFSFIGAAGGITIGQNVLIGQRVSFHAEDHVFDRADLPIKAQGVMQKGIVVEDDCWLGTGAIFLDGVRVGRGSVIAAGSVVTKDVAAYSVMAGVPARLIRSRLEEMNSDPSGLRKPEEPALRSPRPKGAGSSAKGSRGNGNNT
jgi:acetyltransferase-like isoleucine patch superfamily enzyme